MVLPTWLLLLACALCGSLSVGGTSDEEAAEPRLYVFSSLQQRQAATMPPYPVSMQLSLTCQTAGHRDTYWYEKKEGSKDPVKLQSEPNSINGVQSSVYSIQHLAMTDHGRKFMCMKDSSTMREDVILDVVDKPSLAEISFSFDTPVEAEIKCEADGLSSQLELCWYRENEKIHCQVPERMSPSTRTAVTVYVGLPEILEETNTYLCKPQLRAEINTDSLTAATLHRFATMFAEVSRELQIVSQGAVTCNDTRESVRRPDAEEIVVVRSEKDNSKSCYKVAIVEKSVPLPLPLGSPRKNMSTTTSPIMITTSPHIKDVRDQIGDGSPSARACPHQLAVLLLLAFAVV